MSGKHLIDTNILINWLDGNESVCGLSCIANSELYASVITRMELLSAIRNTEAREATIQELLSFFRIVPLNNEVENTAIVIRRETGLKIPDAVIAASSVVTGAILVTRDRRLANVQWPGLNILPLSLIRIDR
jgi:predicted nucleic acid-binding protein